MQGDHDRAFVVAGLTDLAMLEELHAAVIEGARSYDIKAFAGEFDRLVEKYGWEYSGAMVIPTQTDLAAIYRAAVHEHRGDRRCRLLRLRRGLPGN